MKRNKRVYLSGRVAGFQPVYGGSIPPTRSQEITMDEIQKEVQRIYEEHFYKRITAAKALGAENVHVELSMKEMERICDFIAMFAFD